WDRGGLVTGRHPSRHPGAAGPLAGDPLTHAEVRDRRIHRRALGRRPSGTVRLRAPCGLPEARRTVVDRAPVRPYSVWALAYGTCEPRRLLSGAGARKPPHLS